MQSFELPEQIEPPEESTVVVDAESQKLLAMVTSKYGEALAGIKAERYTLHRFVVGLKHLKKKRVQETDEGIGKYIEYHKKYDFDNILVNTSDTPEELQAWPLFIYGQDRQGHPVIYDGVGCSDPNAMDREFVTQDMDKTRLYRARFWRRIENLKHHQMERYGTMISKHMLIFDMKKFKSGHLKGARRKLTGSIISELSDLFPETVHHVFVINAPFPFRAAWKIIKAFMDPVTVKKTHILGKNYLKHMLKHIDISMIPRRYGGKGPWEIRLGTTPEGYPCPDVNSGLT